MLVGLKCMRTPSVRCLRQVTADMCACMCDTSSTDTRLVLSPIISISESVGAASPELLAAWDSYIQAETALWAKKHFERIMVRAPAQRPVGSAMVYHVSSF